MYQAGLLEDQRIADELVIGLPNGPGRTIAARHLRDHVPSTIFTDGVPWCGYCDQRWPCQEMEECCEIIGVPLGKPLAMSVFAVEKGVTLHQTFSTTTRTTESWLAMRPQAEAPPAGSPRWLRLIARARCRKATQWTPPSQSRHESLRLDRQ